MANPSVALVGHEYPPYHIGGVGTYTHDLARYLSKRKVPTTVFCGKSKKLREEKVNDYLTIIRLPLLDLPLRAYWFQLRNYSLLRRRLGDFDVVHAVNPQSSAVCVFAKPERVPMLTTIHSTPVFHTKAFFNMPRSDWTLHDFVSNFVEMPVNEILSTLCFKESQKIIAVGGNLLPELRMAFPDIPADKIEIIQNGIDFERMSLRRFRGRHQDGIDDYVLFYGRLVTAKGTRLLLAAISELKARFPKIKLKVAGTGPLFGELHKFASEIGLLGNVEFLRYVPHDDLIAVIMNSLFVVLPSSYEGGAFSVLEAMACGKAVIALDYPFSREVIDDCQTGLLAKPGQSSDLAKKIELLIEDEGFRNRLGVNAFQLAYRSFNWEKLIDRYVTLYRETAGH